MLSRARGAHPKGRKVCTVFVVDVSDSVTSEAIGDAEVAIRTALDARKPKTWRG